MNKLKLYWSEETTINYLEKATTPNKLGFIGSLGVNADPPRETDKRLSVGSGKVIANLAPRVQGQRGSEAAQNLCHVLTRTLVALFFLPFSEQIVDSLQRNGPGALLDGFEVHSGTILSFFLL